LRIHRRVKARLLDAASVIGGRAYREKNEGEEAELKTGCRFITLPKKIGKRMRKTGHTGRRRKAGSQVAQKLIYGDGECQGNP
jgi:hypothetical protein